MHAAAGCIQAHVQTAATTALLIACDLPCCTAVSLSYQKADEEAAKVYEEFVESFAGDDGGGRDGGVKAFVRGGIVAPGSRSHDATGA